MRKGHLSLMKRDEGLYPHPCDECPMSHRKQIATLGREPNLPDSGHLHVNLAEVSMIAMMAFRTQAHETAGVTPKGSHMGNS